jgi:hypothetical protein
MSTLSAPQPAHTDKIAARCMPVVAQCMLSPTATATHYPPLAATATHHHYPPLTASAAAFYGEAALVKLMLAEGAKSKHDQRRAALKSGWTCIFAAANSGCVRCAFSAEVYTQGWHWFARVLA